MRNSVILARSAVKDVLKRVVTVATVARHAVVLVGIAVKVFASVAILTNAVAGVLWTIRALLRIV